MKIGIIIRKLNIKGGVQRHVLGLAKELKKLGHGIKIYTFVYSKADCYPELLDGLEIISLDYLPGPGRFGAIGYLNYFIGLVREARASKALAALIDQDTKILNPHDHVSYKVAYFFKQKFKNIPSVWTIHDMPTKAFSFTRDRAVNPALRLSPLKKVFYWLVDKYDIGKYIKVQDAIAVLNKSDKEWARRYFGKDAVIIHNGIDLSHFPFSERKAPSSRTAKLLMSGIFMPHRRFEDGIRALKVLLEKNYVVSLRIAGDYNNGAAYFKEISRLVSDLGLEPYVNFLGRVSEDELLGIYRENDVFLFPNHMQSWGLSVFEAMATGLPVVVSKSTGASEVLTHREDAMLVAPKNPDELASAIAEIIKDPNLYATLSVTGRRFVEKEISWSRIAIAMQKVFNAQLSH